MKIRILFIGFLLAGLTTSAQANVVSIEQIQMQEIIRSQIVTGLIDWKVGDSQDYKVTMGFGLQGTMHKEATKEEGNAVWVRQELKLPVANDLSEILIDRDSGKILKFIRNGKEEKLPDDKIEIISTSNDSVEVPAGKFKVLHVIAKSENIKKLELWINPREIAMDGAAKMFMDQGMIQLTMELTKFVKN